MYVAYKNLQSEQETLSVSEISYKSSFTSNNFIKNSMQVKRRVNSNAKIFSLSHNQISREELLQKKEAVQNESQWSISNASSDFNRIGLMGTPRGQSGAV